MKGGIVQSGTCLFAAEVQRIRRAGILFSTRSASHYHREHTHLLIEHRRLPAFCHTRYLVFYRYWLSLAPFLGADFDVFSARLSRTRCAGLDFVHVAASSTYLRPAAGLVRSLLGSRSKVLPRSVPPHDQSRKPEVESAAAAVAVRDLSAWGAALTSASTARLLPIGCHCLSAG